MSLRAYFGKHEPLAISILCGILIIGLLLGLNNSFGLLGTSYDKISITYQQDGDSLRITERQDITVGLNNYNVLYRSFAEDVCLRGDCTINVQSVQCSNGKPYVSKTGTPIDPEHGTAFTVRYDYKIKKDEVGCYSNEGFTNSKDVLEVTYLVPMSHVTANQDRHIIFSSDHFAINELDITSLTGSSHHSLLPKNKRVATNVRSGSVQTSGIPFWIQLLIVLAVALSPYLIWKKYGAEKKFTVPEYLHTIPDPKTPPWQVDVLLNGTDELSKNGMASLLMELYMAEAMTMETKKKFLMKKHVFTIKKDYTQRPLTEKAKKLVGIIATHKTSENAETMTCTVGASDNSFSLAMKAFFKTGDVKEYVRSVMDTTGNNIVMTIVTGLMILGVVIYQFVGGGAAFIIFVGLIGLGIVKSLYPSSIFSRFREDNYKTYLEWHAFNKMLTDYAQIKKYLKEDSAIWKEWLVYATAMGSAKKVIKACKELNVLSPELYENVNRMHSSLLAFSVLSYSSAHPRSSGGGGIGGGGGFGGGGGGGR